MFRSFTLFVLLGWAVTTAWADATATSRIPQPYSARYSGALGLLDAHVTLARTATGLRYEYRSNVAGRVLYECSVMMLKDGEPVPVEYLHKEIDGDGHRDQHIRFDAAARVVTINHGGETRSFPDLQFPVWDALSAQLKVAADIAAGNTRLSYQVADKGGIKTRNFRVGQPAKVSFKGKDYDGIRIERDEPKKKFYTIVAPDLNYVPVEMGYHAKVFGWITAGLREYRVGSSATVPARCEPR